MRTPASRYSPDQLGALRRFAVAITLFNVAGHAFLGFEQSILQPVVALGAAYGLELILELIDARLHRRVPRFIGGPRVLVQSLLSAHITGLATAMLLYASDRLWPIAFSAAAAIGAKSVFRVAVGKQGSRHFFNPSNFGITLTLLLFPTVGIAPPYHFTENLTGFGDWLLPLLICVSGMYLNARFTHRVPLIGAWVAGFAGQAIVRSALGGAPVAATLLPMTGVAFLLFTFYMLTDPATTPNEPRTQLAFGGAVAAVYGLLVSVHVVFGLFFALTIVSALRGGLQHAGALLPERASPGLTPVPQLAAAGPRLRTTVDPADEPATVATVDR